ncbi:hypothetical protein DFJ74DRAFT_74194 [Hyaloraphidium curvatum]|nr:hypothetical protein DFJ74DRAFT_74194 [Hyaloraphidium curvatum]
MPHHDHANAVRCLVQVEAQTGKEAALLEGLKKLKEAAKENHAIEYEIVVGAENAAQFAIIELWKEKADEDKYMESAAYKDLISKAGELLAGAPNITYWKHA